MKQTIKIEGMSCHHCEMRIEKALKNLKGVKKAKVSHEEGNAIIDVKKHIEEGAIRDAVKEAGYNVTEVE